MKSKFVNIIISIRLFFISKEEPYFSLSQLLGFAIRKKELYNLALLHRSSSLKDETGRWLNNERLEFLGDTILDAVIADYLYHKYPRKREGFLTDLKSKIVQRSTLNQVGKKMGLENMVISSRLQQGHNQYVAGNAVEALIGAIYLDKGFDICKQFIEKRLLREYIDVDQLSKAEINFKSKLIEWGQRNRVMVDFVLVCVTNEGTDHPLFTSSVVLNDQQVATGSGYSKKESHQTAAKSAYFKIKKEKEFVASLLQPKTDSHLLALED